MTIDPTDNETTFIVKDIDTTAQLKKLARYEEREPLVQELATEALGLSHEKTYTSTDDDVEDLNRLGQRVRDFNLDIDR